MGGSRGVYRSAVAPAARVVYLPHPLLPDRGDVVKDPHVAIEGREFKSGWWWWASVEFADVSVTSGYCRSRDVAVRKLKKILRRMEYQLAFAKGFLGGWGR